MATAFDLDTKEDQLIGEMRKAVQSAGLNFLIGSGCSSPALAVLGNIEKEIEAKIIEGKIKESEIMILDMVKPLLKITHEIKSNPEGNSKATLETYKVFLTTISKIIFERKGSILPKQANIFSTNYDLFVEKAFEDAGTFSILNDGFIRRPSLSFPFRFSSAEFFNSVYNNGNLYEYRVQIPSINLVKLHGSLSWKNEDSQIIYGVDDLEPLLEESRAISNESTIEVIQKFNRKCSIILPTKEKFEDSILNQNYYDLLRIYANELDKPNTVLFVEGFSFSDDHILKITKRALKNPTLRLIVFCHKTDELSEYERKFSVFNNVNIVFSSSKEILFSDFNSFLGKIFPSDFALTGASQGEQNG